MLSPQWYPLLRNHQPVKMLVTLNINGLDPSSDRPHLATQPGSYCLSSDFGVECYDSFTGRTIPFWPWLAQWPDVRRRLSPMDRRAEISASQIQVLSDSGLIDTLFERGSAQSMTGRIDLWTDGLTDLRYCIPRLAGTVRTPATMPSRGGGLSLSITDGEPEFGREFLDVITHEHFPDAPVHVAGIEALTTIIGPFPERVLAKCISSDRRTFFLCTPPATVAPTSIEKGGVRVTRGVRVRTATSALGMDYTEIVFDRPVDDFSEGISDEVSASGGVGVTSQNALAYLVDYAGFETTSRARAYMPTFNRDFPLAVLVNKRSKALDLIRNIVAQTPYAMTFMRNRFDLIRLDEQGGEIKLGIGNGLLFRLPDDRQQAETDLSSIWNAIEVRCSRDQFASTATATTPLYVAYRDSGRGSADIRSLCAKSEALYGRRFLQFDAADLAVNVDSSGRILGSPGGDYMADFLVRTHALPRRPHAYLADWLSGLSVDLNTKAMLTDADENLADKKTRVVEIGDTPNGIELFCLEEVSSSTTPP